MFLTVRSDFSTTTSGKLALLLHLMAYTLSTLYETLYNFSDSDSEIMLKIG